MNLIRFIDFKRLQNAYSGTFLFLQKAPTNDQYSFFKCSLFMMFAECVGLVAELAGAIVATRRATFKGLFRMGRTGRVILATLAIRWQYYRRVFPRRWISEKRMARSLRVDLEGELNRRAFRIEIGLRTRSRLAEESALKTKNRFL